MNEIDTPAPSSRETDDRYLGVKLRWKDTRVIQCRDGIQWIVQYLRGKQWRSKHHYRFRASLERLLPDHATEIAAALPVSI